MLRLQHWAKAFARPSVQLAVATAFIVVSTLMTVSVFLRFIPGAERLAIGRNEPFWVLLLSVLALLFAGYTALPAALAYREVKSNGERKLDD